MAYQSHRSDNPPTYDRNETIHGALGRANTANSIKPHFSSRSSNSGSVKSSHSSSHEASRRSSKSKGHDPSCECMTCRDPSYRTKLGVTRRDSDGNLVTEPHGSEPPPVHCHVKPGIFGEDDTRHHSSRRTSSSGDGGRGSASRKNSDNYSYRDRENNLVTEHRGAEAPQINTHYNWDSADGVPTYARRTNPNSGHN
jgi:hypothetical protein